MATDSPDDPLLLCARPPAAGARVTQMLHVEPQPARPAHSSSRKRASSRVSNEQNPQHLDHRHVFANSIIKFAHCSDQQLSLARLSAMNRKEHHPLAGKHWNSEPADAAKRHILRSPKRSKGHMKFEKDDRLIKSPKSVGKSKKHKDGRQQNDLSGKHDTVKNPGNDKSHEDTKKAKTLSNMFSHLAPYQPHLSGISASKRDSLHPAVLELGRLYEIGSIRGGNARCRAMLRCFSKLVADYKPPSDGNNEDIREHFNKHILKVSFSYWTEHCRRHSVGMGNAFAFLKSAVASLERGTITLKELQSFMQETIKKYIQERIDFADTAIVKNVSTKIDHSGEVLLVYGLSEIICKVLVMQQELSKNFGVIVVDSRPLLEGCSMLETLRKAGISCTYIILQSVSYVMKDVTKVLLGAAAVLGDGSIQGRIGTACVAMMAQDKPVLVCCETNKMTYRVQLGSFADNELGDSSFKSNDGEQNDLQMFSPIYDVTPSSFISGFVTEVGILPPTSVAALIRELDL